MAELPKELYLALHNNDPGPDGTQLTNEVRYVGYRRVALAREHGIWSVAEGAAHLRQAIEFGECRSGADQASWLSIGVSAVGAGAIIYRTQVTETQIHKGVVPRVRSVTVTES